MEVSQLKEKVFEVKDKREAYFHTQLVQAKKLSIASQKANKKTRDALGSCGNFEGIAQNQLGFDFPLDFRLEEKLLLNLLSTNFNLLTFKDELFPDMLKQDTTLTPIIYTRGNLDLLEKKTMGFVGTRGSNGQKGVNQDLTKEEYYFGQKAAQRVAQNYTIVSGIAFGSDSLGHKEALKTPNSTIGVIAKPINEIYSKKNKDLQEKIAQEGLLVSEFPFGTKFYSSHLTQRNKTTVALSSEGLVVLYAGDKSGTVHAIKEAVRQEKPIYVVGNLPNSQTRWFSEYREHIVNFNSEK